MTKAFNHYYKNVSGLDEVDVYRILELFEVTNPAIAHAIKKLLVAGGRGSKSLERDVSEAISTLQRWQGMRLEDVTRSPSIPMAIKTSEIPIDPLPGTIATSVREDRKRWEV